MNKPMVNITIPVFNRFELTQLTIININKMNRDIPFSVTVIDNGSELDLQKQLIQFKEDGLIDNLYILEKNYGISCACNIGFKSIDAPFYIKWDNDVVVKDQYFLKKLFSMYQQVESTSILGPALASKWINESKEIISTPYGKLAACHTSVPGTCLLIPKCVSDVLGYFCEDYNLYGGEDGDYGMRVNLAGFHQYYYEYEHLFDHRGKWDSSEYVKYNFSKEKEHKELFELEDGTVGLVSLNFWLYDNLIRSWNVPLRFEIEKQDGYFVTIRERPEYEIIRQALIRSQKIFNHHLLLITDPKKFANNFIPVTAVEKLKKIWAKCGQECIGENLIKN